MPALAVSAYAFGGWATITVDDFPEAVVAAQPTTLSFVVRQHGVTLLGRLSPTVSATDGKAEVAGKVAARETGHYSAKLTLPRAGDWSITVNSGFGNSRLKLPPVRALTAGSPAPAPRTPFDRGQRLFVAKGCVTCHVHGTVAAVGYASLEVGPELTPKRYEADYLRRYLIDPSIARTPGRPQMPALGLAPAEISALVAFINADRSVAARR
jgi:mono/diheme cytochrome c family protein